jgi:hypothetical protein
MKHVPQKACPGLDPGWAPVLRKGHAQTKSKTALKKLVPLGQETKDKKRRARNKGAMTGMFKIMGPIR